MLGYYVPIRNNPRRYKYPPALNVTKFFVIFLP